VKRKDILVESKGNNSTRCFQVQTSIVYIPEIWRQDDSCRSSPCWLHDSDRDEQKSYNVSCRRFDSVMKLFDHSSLMLRNAKVNYKHQTFLKM